MCAIHRDSLIALFQTGGAEKGSDYKFQGKSSAVSADIYGSDLTFCDHCVPKQYPNIHESHV